MRSDQVKRVPSRPWIWAESGEASEVIEPSTHAATSAGARWEGIRAAPEWVCGFDRLRGDKVWTSRRSERRPRRFLASARNDEAIWGSRPAARERRTGSSAPARGNSHTPHPRCDAELA